MTKIAIRPDRYRQFGSGTGATFCLVTNSGIVDHFFVERTGGYSDWHVITLDQEGDINRLLKDVIPEPAHVLVVSPECFFRSPDPDLIGPKRKLIAMACNSTPTPLESIRHFLLVIENTDPAEQQAFADRFFTRGEATSHMEFVDQRTGTRAIFEHLNDRYEWNLQAGPLEWGEQQIAPAGEISVLPADIWDFSERLKLAINGQITFGGHPILHAGEVSFLRADQRRLHDGLSKMTSNPVIADVVNGVITSIRPHANGDMRAVKTLETMFAVDSRYRILWELGFAINTALSLLPGNFAMNEVFGGRNGCLHYGLGLTPYTQYHLDVISPDTWILDADGTLLFGGDPARTDMKEAVAG